MSLVSPAYADSCGSMAHELVHLLIKRRFSGAPAWLEEGLASEVAVASPSATSLRFGWSWRDDTLLKDLDARPTASQLLDASWSDFNSDNYGGMHRAEATQAIAAVFIRYLNAKGQLPAIYFSVRDQHLTPDLSGFKSYQATLEDILKMPVASIDADFQKWFDAESRGHAPAYSSGGGSGEVMNAAPRPIKPCVQSQSKMQQAALCAPDAPAAGNDPPKPNTKQSPGQYCCQPKIHCESARVSEAGPTSSLESEREPWHVSAYFVFPEPDTSTP